jgi:hypothetical protein
MADVLIIRSVGLQQLDLLLPRLVAAFKGQRLVLLTHPHSLEAVSKYPELAEVLAYTHKGSYQPWRRVALGGRRFDSVIVPVSSLEGGGFFNVLAFAATLPARQLMLCRPDGELEPLTRTGLLRQFGLRLLAAVAAGLGTLLLMPLLLLLPLWLWRLQQGAGKDV